MAFQSLAQIVKACKERQKEFWEIVIEDDMTERKISMEESMEQMTATWDAILFAAATYEKNLHSKSGLVGGDGYKMESYIIGNSEKKPPLCGGFIGSVMAAALQMGESNACMKRIVAAPTAGSCGVLPAVLVPYYKKHNIANEQIVKSMYVAAGIGQVIATRAFISGASGGCQAEIGSASAMAAGAMVYLQAGSAEQIVQASAIALKSLLGLVCDPVAGLVEVPCVKRNVIGAVNALTAADMSMAGIISRIPPDQVIDAMAEIGDKMDASLKETGEGGLAATPTGRKIQEEMI